MKKRLNQLYAFFILCILLPMNGAAQCPTLTQCCLPNGNFAQASCVGESAFLSAALPITPNNCVPFWTATHGSPGLYTISNPSNYALLASGNSAYGFASEGIRTNFTFEQGTSYEVTFKVRCHDPFNLNAIHNPGNLTVRAMNNGPSASQDFWGNLDHTMPTIPTPNQLITTITTNSLPYVGQNWETVTVSFIASADYGQLWFYLNSLNSSQSILIIDDVSVKQSPPTAQFHMQANGNTNGTPTSQFTTCEHIFLNGLASVNDQHHYIDVWSRATGSGNPFTWAGNFGSNGWTLTPAGVVDITNAMGMTFTAGYDYQIKFATQNTCTGWVESTTIISVVSGGSIPNPVTQIESHTPGYVPPNGHQECEDVYLVETYESTHGMNYTQYFVDVWVRNYALGGSFQWLDQIDPIGWTPGTLPARLNIKSIFNGQGTYFTAGNEYEVKLALANSCSSWAPTTARFRVVSCAAPIQSDLSKNGSIDDSELFDLNDPSKLSVSPNPAESTIILSVDAFEKIEVLNSLGQTLIVQTDGSSLIDISQLPSGFYMVMVTHLNGTQQKATFIKE